MSDNESVLSSLSSESNIKREMEMSEGEGEAEEEEESGTETEPLQQTTRRIGEEGDSEEDMDEMGNEDDDNHGNDDGMQQPSLQDRMTGSSSSKTAKRQNNQTSSLSVPSKRRRLSFDDGSDLSALTSENEMQEMEDDEDDEEDADNDNDDPGMHQEMDLDPDHHNPAQQIQGKDFYGNNASNNDAPNMVGASLSSAPMQQTTSTASSSLDESSSSSSNNARKRGKGRPPRRQNALAAAAKRQALKAARRSMDGELPSTMTPKQEEAPEQESYGQGEANFEAYNQQVMDNAEEEDITSEGERLAAPPPFFPDDSADEDYHESSSTSRTHQPPSSSSRQRKKPTSSRKSLSSAQKSRQRLRQSISPGRRDDTDAAIDSENGTDNAKIVVTEASEQDIGQKGDIPVESETESHLPAALASAVDSAAAASADQEDAMSGISDDIPILLQATAKATAAIKAMNNDERDSSLAPPAEANIRDAYTPDLESAPTHTSSSFLPVPSPSLTSRHRARSPNSTHTSTSRGRGRGTARGRGKKGQQQQHQHRLLDHDDTEISASGNEGAGQLLADGEREGSHGLETPAASDHEEGGEPVDSNASRKRADAIEALTKIEIEFARIRDILYMEKMEEVARERWQVEAGIHPELLHLFQLIEHRRRAKLDLAKRTLSKSEDRHQRQAEASYRAVWYDWIEARYQLRKGLVDEGNVKRRRLDREKRAIERPKNEDLSTILRIHAPPPYMYVEKKAAAVYGNDYSLEFEVAESIQKKRKRGAVGLDQDEALYDLERMGLRDPYHGSYPAHFAFDPAYGHMPGSTQAIPFGYDHTPSIMTGQQHQHPLAAQGRTVASVPQHGQTGRPDPFSAYRVQAAQATLPQHHSLSSQNPAYSMKSQIHRPTLDDHLASGPHAAQVASRTAGSAAFGLGHERINSRGHRGFEYGLNPKVEQHRPMAGYYAGITAHGGM